MSRAALVSLFVLACSGNKEPEPPPVPQAPADAGIDGITTIGGYDPASGMHLDDGEDPPDRPQTPKRGNRGSTPIGILLKSEPIGATVYVDGNNLGTTPKYWAGVADGNEHEFVFVMSRYALARYKFVPITNGTLHATLTRVIGGETLDAGLDPVIAPKFAPDAAIPAPPDAPVASPPTVLSPPDAAIAAPRSDAAVVAPRVDAAPATPPADAAPAPTRVEL